ncbi:MAG: ThuA domain-containing protein [Armatimonadota bacterium]
MSNKVRVLVWDENPSHRSMEIYPDSLRTAIAAGLQERDTANELIVSTACLDDENQGVTQAVLDNTDVLIWWGHARHGEVKDEIAEMVKNQVHKKGMGFICLHSGHYSKTFKAVLNCTGHLFGGWREADDVETIQVCAPWHPIAEGVSNFVIDEEEMYGSPFDTPPPLTNIFQSHFSVGNESFPSGMTWTVGDGIDPEFTSGPGNGVNQGYGIGRVFYFRPGHETYPTYFNADVRTVIYNGVRWAAKITG